MCRPDSHKWSEAKRFGDNAERLVAEPNDLADDLAEPDELRKAGCAEPTAPKTQGTLFDGGEGE
jgi:hypothetical protein